MKKTLFLFCAVTLVGAIDTACEKDANLTDVPFTEYSLANTSSHWIDAQNADPSLVIINSNAELSAYIDGTDYPPVDFTTKTLLLAHGIEGYSNTPDKVMLQQLSEQNYLMIVNFQIGLEAVITPWQVAMIVDKLSTDSKVELSITRK